jgi:hypothetical protein
MLGGTPGGAVKCRTESMQGGDDKDEKRNCLQPDLADAPPHSYYIPMSTWSLLAINMGHCHVQLRFTPDSILQSGEEGHMPIKLGCHESLATASPCGEGGLGSLIAGERTLSRMASGCWGKALRNRESGGAPTAELPSWSRFRSSYMDSIVPGHDGWSVARKG